MHQTLIMSNMLLTSQVQCNHHSQTQGEGTPGAPVSASPAPQNYEHIPDTEPISGYVQCMARGSCKVKRNSNILYSGRQYISRTVLYKASSI